MKIIAIGDPHGDLETIKQIPITNIDLILLTGDLGSATLMRKMAFENIERKKQGLPERKYSSKQEKRAFMEAYNTTLQIIKYLSKFAPKHWQGKHAGSKLILRYIKKAKPKYVFCGHIHEGKGKVKIGKAEIYNLGVCGYKIINL